MKSLYLVGVVVLVLTSCDGLNQSKSNYSSTKREKVIDDVREASDQHDLNCGPAAQEWSRRNAKQTEENDTRVPEPVHFRQVICERDTSQIWCFPESADDPNECQEGVTEKMERIMNCDSGGNTYLKGQKIEGCGFKKNSILVFYPLGQSVRKKKLDAEDVCPALEAVSDRNFLKDEDVKFTAISETSELKAADDSAVEEAVTCLVEFNDSNAGDICNSPTLKNLGSHNDTSICFSEANNNFYTMSPGETDVQFEVRVQYRLIAHRSDPNNEQDPTQTPTAEIPTQAPAPEVPTASVPTLIPTEIPSSGPAPTKNFCMLEYPTINGNFAAFKNEHLPGLVGSSLRVCYNSGLRLSRPNGIYQNCSVLKTGGTVGGMVVFHSGPRTGARPETQSFSHVLAVLSNLSSCP